jgi:hypothetical protein
MGLFEEILVEGTAFQLAGALSEDAIRDAVNDVTEALLSAGSASTSSSSSGLLGQNSHISFPAKYPLDIFPNILSTFLIFLMSTPGKHSTHLKKLLWMAVAKCVVGCHVLVRCCMPLLASHLPGWPS